MHLELHAGAPSEWRESIAEQCAEGGLSSTSHPTSDPHHHHHHDGQSKKKKTSVFSLELYLNARGALDSFSGIRSIPIYEKIVT